MRPLESKQSTVLVEKSKWSDMESSMRSMQKDEYLVEINNSMDVEMMACAGQPSGAHVKDEVFEELEVRKGSLQTEE